MQSGARSNTNDEYHEVLEKVIQEKIEYGEEKAPAPAKKKPTNVIDLVSVLQRSIQQTQAKPKSGKAAKKTRAANRRRAA